TGLDDEKGAAALAEALGGLPLALEQAAAYIEETGQTFAGYLKLFTTNQVALFGHKAGARPDDHATVATLWELSVQKLTPEAAALLNLCACLAPDGIGLDR